jgi:solute carrier family 35 protein E3
VLVLLLGWVYLNDSMSVRKLGGMVMAVMGMVMYGYFTSVQQVIQASVCVLSSAV